MTEREKFEKWWNDKHEPFFITEHGGEKLYAWLAWQERARQAEEEREK
jgi:hypothetical protein